MSLDLFERETSERMRTMTPAVLPDVGVFDGFARGTGIYTMRGLAKAGRAIDLLGSVGPIAKDYFTGGTEAQDRYFREHDEVWGSAVDYWTPKPREVGAAAEIAGTLLSVLPQVLASPALAVGTTILSTAEDLVKKGVEAQTATMVGVAQGAGLGLGIYMPIFGRTLAERVLAGGIGFNVLQGVGMRAAGEVLLKGTPGEGDFKALDPAALTLDVLLGAAFGAIVHLSPTQRAQGAEMWGRLQGWAGGLKQSDIDALAVLRQAQHLNADSMPGKPTDPVDVERHVARMRQALEQLARNEPVDVSDLDRPVFGADAERMAEANRNIRSLQDVAERVLSGEDRAEGMRREIDAFIEQQRIATGVQTVRQAAEGAQRRVTAEETPAFLRSAEEMIALRADQESAELEPVVKQAVEIAKKPAFQRTAAERILLEGVLNGRLPDFLQPRNAREESALGKAVSGALKEMKKPEPKAPAAALGGEAEPPPPRGRAPGEAAGAEGPDPVALAAERFVERRPDLMLRVGQDADGKPILKSAKEYLEGVRQDTADAMAERPLYEAAAICLFGRA